MSEPVIVSVCVFRTYMRVKDRVEADKDKVRSIALSPHHTHKPKILK